jgi:hypothetical protein
MRAVRQPRPLGFTRALRLATALVTMAQLLLVAAAPLAERPDSTVAAVHVEQAGTSAHHAHGELCAVCVASHLVAPPARAAVGSPFARATARTKADGRIPSTAADRLDTQPRAPPA